MTPSDYIWMNIINDENYSDYPIGKLAPIDFGEYGVHNMELVAKDLDVRADGDTDINNGKARMTWLLKDILIPVGMNSSDTTSGGWPNTAMRSWLRGTILPMLTPVKDYIVPVIKTYKDYSSNSTKSVEDTIWIPSVREIHGITDYENSGVDYTSKFSSASDKIKLFNGGASSWWHRSAYSASEFWYTNALGNNHAAVASYTLGVVFGFCL